MQHEVVVRNNDAGLSYNIVEDLSEEQVRAIERLGLRLTQESDWSLTVTVLPVALS